MCHKIFSDSKPRARGMKSNKAHTCSYYTHTCIAPIYNQPSAWTLRWVLFSKCSPISFRFSQFLLIENYAVVGDRFLFSARHKKQTKIVAEFCVWVAWLLYCVSSYYMTYKSTIAFSRLLLLMVVVLLELSAHTHTHTTIFISYTYLLPSWD